MKEIIYTQNNPQLRNRKIENVLRIDGKILYFKFNDSQYAQQIIAQLQSKGAYIEIGKTWIKVDMFKDQELVKLGNKEFDVTETSGEEVEKILCEFYVNQFTKAKFEVKVK